MAQHGNKGQLRNVYRNRAIQEYEYSPAPEYEKRRMTAKASSEGTVDFDSDADVEISTDGAWVSARVWVPKDWLG